MSKPQSVKRAVIDLVQWIASAAVGALFTYVGHSYFFRMRFMGPPDPDPMAWLLVLYLPGFLLAGVVDGVIGRFMRLLHVYPMPSFEVKELFFTVVIMNFLFYTFITYLVIRWCRKLVN